AAVSFTCLLVAGCSNGSQSMTTTTTPTATGASFIVGTDAPLASVTSFSVQVNNITATDGNGNKVSLLSGSPTLDFARFNGLQTLLDMNDVAVGTYNKVTITLGAATIGYLDTSTSEPTIQTKSATLTTSTIDIMLANPMVVVHAGAPVGLH